MAEMFVLIPGRTRRQGCGVSEGKLGEKYQSEISVLRMAPPDMERLGLAAGDRVRLIGEGGRIEVQVAAAEEDELPPGMLFIPYGEVSCRLMGSETHGSGMPTSKGLDVRLEKV